MKWQEKSTVFLLCIFLHGFPRYIFLTIYLFPIRREQENERASCFHLPRTPARYLYWSNYENIQFGSTHRTRQICESKIRLRYICIDTKLWSNVPYKINLSFLWSGYSYIPYLYFPLFLFRDIVLPSFYSKENSFRREFKEYIYSSFLFLFRSNKVNTN